MGTNVDSVVRMAIEDLFPGHSIPDEQNYLSDNRQFKAPDFSIDDNRILVELKSLNSKHDSKLIVSDNTSMEGSNATIEHFLGRKMGGYNAQEDRTGIIDAIIYVAAPENVWDRENSYWFKYLIKKRVAPEGQELLGRIAAALHHRVAHYAPYYPHAAKFRHGFYRPVSVG